ERDLTQGGPASPEKRLNHLMKIASLHLYEGEVAKAAAVLEDARALAEGDLRRFEKQLPTVIFFQGVSALRRAGPENCVENCCDTSCIFPIQPRAYHAKQEGSLKAVQYFTEYLQGQPRDLGVR